MKISITDTKRFIALFLSFALLFCAILGGLIFLGQYIDKENDSPAFSSTSPEPTVIIDAGHGGEDGGAVGFDDIYEKDINLSIALTLYGILRANGINAVLTRQEDVLLYDKNSNYHGQKKIQDLATRRRITENCENAIFISIHMNTFPEEKYSGLQVYYSVNDQTSRALAENIQGLTRELLMPNNTRKCKAADNSIYLLDRLQCPAVLVECGFLSNRAECDKLSKPEYQKQLALCLASSVIKYINDTKKAADLLIFD